MACRGLVMPGAIAWLDAPFLNSSNEQWRVVVMVADILFYDVTISRRQTNGLSKFFHNMHIHIQGRRRSGRAGGGRKRVEGSGNL